MPAASFEASHGPTRGDTGPPYLARVWGQHSFVAPFRFGECNALQRATTSTASADRRASNLYRFLTDISTETTTSSRSLMPDKDAISRSASPLTVGVIRSLQLPLRRGQAGEWPATPQVGRRQRGDWPTWFGLVRATMALAS